MKQTIRRIAAAGVFGAVLVMFCDAALQLSLSAIQTDGYRAVPWAARVIKGSVWIVAATLVWLASGVLAARLTEAPALESTAGIAPHAALRLVGLGLIAAPMVWQVATWTVWAVTVTLTDNWSSEGRVLLEPSYYSNLILTNAPWILAGIMLLAVSRHRDTG